MLPLMKIYIMLFGCAVISLQSFHKDITNALENSHQSYFEKRRTILKNMKVTYIKRQKNSHIPKEYFENHQSYTHNFKRLINEPHLCSQHEKIFLLFTIRSVYYHFSRRQIQRKIIYDIPNDNFSTNLIVKHVFLFGKTDNSTVESLIQKESKKYRDIIQEDFVESYTNVSLKTIMAWKWSVEFCANTDYVVVMNDELFVDQYKLFYYLRYLLAFNKHNDNFAACYKTGNSRTNRKFFTQKHIDMSTFYKGDYYPFFCHGVGYVAHINLINKLYSASLSNHIFMPDDVWNGLLAEKLNISLRNQNNLYTLDRPIERFSHPMYKFSHLMFGVTDYRENRNHVPEILKNLSDILKIQRRLYKYKIPDFILKRYKKDVAGKKCHKTYIEEKNDIGNLVLMENKLNNLVNYEYWNVGKYIFMVLILIIILKSVVKFRMWSRLWTLGCNLIKCLTLKKLNR